MHMHPGRVQCQNTVRVEQLHCSGHQCSVTHTHCCCTCTQGARGVQELADTLLGKGDLPVVGGVNMEALGLEGVARRCKAAVAGACVGTWVWGCVNVRGRAADMGELVEGRCGLRLCTGRAWVPVGSHHPPASRLPPAADQHMRQCPTLCATATPLPLTYAHPLICTRSQPTPRARKATSSWQPLCPREAALSSAKHSQLPSGCASARS